MRSGSKLRAQRAHAKRRAASRYGLSLNRLDLRAIVKKIQTGNGTHVATQSHRVSLWDVEWQGQTCRVVYDKERKSVVSFLPQGDKNRDTEPDPRSRR